jgi:hypothetical protein
MSQWSGYEFQLSDDEVKKIFQMEARIEDLKGSPAPYIAERVTGDFAEAKIPRTGSALKFFIRASRFSDGVHTEAIAAQLAASFARSPEQFVQVLEELTKIDGTYPAHTAKIVEFGDSYIKPAIQKKSIQAALKLEAKSQPELKVFFDFLRSIKDC